MSVPAAYLGIIAIWSTTPLAIKWSGEGPGFLFGVTGRMVLGALLCLALLKPLRVAFPWHRDARRAYLGAGLGIYGAMTSTYWAAQYVPSGLISVLFGLTPIVTGILATLWLSERSFTPPRLLGMAAGLAGLVVIFGTRLGPGSIAVFGVAALLFAVCVHSASAVWVKRTSAGIPALAVTAGALLHASVLLLATWALFDGVWPARLPARALYSIVYLGIIGSVVGFVLYYYTLKRLDAGQIAMITLVTPVMALLLGTWLNGEEIAADVAVGAVLILSGLLAYQWREVAPYLRRRAPPAAAAQPGVDQAVEP